MAESRPRQSVDLAASHGDPGKATLGSPDLRLGPAPSPDGLSRNGSGHACRPTAAFSNTGDQRTNIADNSCHPQPCVFEQHPYEIRSLIFRQSPDPQRQASALVAHLITAVTKPTRRSSCSDTVSSAQAPVPALPAFYCQRTEPAADQLNSSDLECFACTWLATSLPALPWEH